MNSGPLDVLLEKLTQGDPAAAEQIFLTYEPYLRIVVRRQLSEELRAKFDSVDIVQSVWADVLDGFRQSKWSFRDVNHLRAFLVKVTRNRFIDRLRQHRGALEREMQLPPGEIDALPAHRAGRVSEVVYAQELWDRMLEVCPPAHYELLHLKRQGMSLAEIAERTGLHPSSVRRILYEIGRRLGLKEPAGSSDPA
jgi:RNA polymerase sigma-70 factor (ECF subfamily)